jgi:tetratricopeptide (TPR) repeat protein
MMAEKSKWKDRPTGEKPISGEKVKASVGQAPLPVETAKGENKGLQEAIRFFENKQWDKALQKIKLIIADKSNAAEQEELAYYTGLCYSKLGQFENAILYLEQIVVTSKHPVRSHQCRMALAYAYIKTGRAKMAEFELKRLKNAGFESASMYNAMAYAAYAQKRYLQAIDYYEKTLALDKNNATALNSMGYILADRDIDAEKGAQLCQKAVESSPNNAAYMDSMGWAYYKCGDMAGARKWLQKALAAAPHEKEISGHFMIVNGGAV